MKLLHFDLIGETPGLYVNNHSNHRSGIGGIFTILAVILGILCTIGFGLDIIQKQKPDIFSSKKLNYTNNINGNEMIFAIAPMLVGGARIPNLSRRISPAALYSSTNGPESNFTTISLVKCKDTRLFKQNLFGVMSQLIVDENDYFCLPDEVDWPLKGKFGNAAFTLIELFIT